MACSKNSRCVPMNFARAIHVNSPVGSGSEWEWLAPWPPIPPFCSSTNLSELSIPSPGSNCSSNSWLCGAISTRRPSSSPTMYARHSNWEPALPSWRRGGSKSSPCPPNFAARRPRKRRPSWPACWIRSEVAMRSDLLDNLLRLTAEHLVLVLSAMAIAILLGVPLGIWSARQPVLRRWVLGFSSVAQTIPSLALFGFLIPIPYIGGIGPRTVIVALVLYALLPILRNTVVGIASVDPAVCEAATAMGMTRGQLLCEVQLPLAARTILAGVRVAAVTTIGTATIAAAIGGGGLGVFIFRGVASVDTTQILAGAIPAAAIALLADGGLGWIERKVSP